jgi:secreted Zn-dependent insulinase-like peptidase
MYKTETRSLSLHSTKTHSKYINDLNVRLETLKLLQKTLQDVHIGNDFLTRTLIAQKIIARIDKLDYTKLKSFCIAKETITRVKRQLTE